MADENKVFDVEIITPDRVFFTGTATMIEFNTAAGELGVYARHIPLTTVLAPGVVTIHKQGEEDIIAAVHSGFAEILPEKVTLLAEIAEWPNEIDKARAEAAKVCAAQGAGAYRYCQIIKTESQGNRTFRFLCVFALGKDIGPGIYLGWKR